MKGVLTLLSLVIAGLIIFAVPYVASPNLSEYGTPFVTVGDTGKAVLLCAVLATIAGFYCYRQGEDGGFLLKIFVLALLLRLILGTFIFIYSGQEFFGGDALTYDYIGFAQLKAWGGDRYFATIVQTFVGDTGASAWGMIYFVAAVYGLIGRNMLAIQFINSVVGALTAPVIFLCAQQVFNNRRVARLAAMAVAFYPSLVLWSSQGLKDGPIVFFLALCILATLKLGQKFTVKYLAVLAISLFCLLSLRFYVFYMICVAIAGALIIGMQALTATSFIRQFAAVILLGMALTYVGITRSAATQFEEYGNLERLQVSREDQARSAQSGFGRDVDVSTTSGALSSIPMGILYLLFAPFPWQVASLRQSITLPEMIVWWGSFPLLVLGLWFAIRYRLRMISPILIFTVMLTVAYSVFQGNVGTAYRQRAQLLVFYFIFIAVGLVLVQEKREERKRSQLARGRELTTHQVSTDRARTAVTTK
jgi:hypothetical protein